MKLNKRSLALPNFRVHSAIKDQQLTERSEVAARNWNFTVPNGNCFTRRARYPRHRLFDFMKTTFINRIILSVSGLILFAGWAAQAQLPFKSLDESPTSPQEDQELASVFDTARATTAKITPGPDAGF